jgi:hypothetical protein
MRICQNTFILIFFFFEKTTHFNEKLYLGFKPHFSEGIHPEICSQPFTLYITHVQFISFISKSHPNFVCRSIQGVSKFANSEFRGGREGPSGARKYVEKKFALPEEDISLHIHSDKIPF